MQLAKIQRDGKLVLQADALNYLRKLGKGILVVAVFGGARSAKSTTANMLLGKQAFGMSNTTDPCTFGVWIESRPHQDGKVLLVVDSEGMGKGDTSQHSKILGLVSLLASDGGVLIDNEMKDLGEHNLGTLGVLATMNQMLRGTQKYSWPALVVLLRDFTLTLKIGKRTATPLQYLHHVLEDPGEKVDETRKLIRDCFVHQNLFTFPPPTEQEQMSMLNLPPGTFKNTFEAMKTYLFENLTSKTIMEDECDGEKLVDLLETCVDSLNKDNGVDIPNAHDVVVERFCRRLVGQLVAKYSEELPESTLTGDEAKLLETHTSARFKSIESFDSQTSGFTSDRVKQCKDELEERLNKEYEILKTKNKLKLEEKRQKELHVKEHFDFDQPRRRASSPNRIKHPNRPMTVNYAGLRPGTAEFIQQLQADGDMLRERIEHLELNQRHQHLSPQIHYPSPPPVSYPSPPPMHYSPQYAVPPPAPPTQPSVVVNLVVSPPSSPTPTERPAQAPAQPPSRHQRRLSVGNAGMAGVAGNSGNAGRLSPVFGENAHRVAQPN
eukprot:Phypoly_transcript_05855.p1 GENE.Phypoly_transcript_05855~~Phypoly_transcript_05855.p1  ORF type:complete len:550 (+),score=94.30 Phypoly_transcript_05855:231-1880(+)